VTGRLVWVAPFALACSANTPIYFPSPEPDMVVPGLDANGNPSRAENGLSLRFRNPTQQEAQTIASEAATLGFKVPWIARDHVHLSLTYEVTDLETPSNPDGGSPSNPNDPAEFNIGIDGGNEFERYNENIVAMTLQQGNDDAPTYIPLIPVTPQTIAPGQTITGTVREDDFNEAELDLYAIGEWMAPFNAVLINNSQVNPIGLEMVPANAIIPALVEVDVNFMANRMMKCVYDVRVRDDNDQLLHETTDTLFTPSPTLIVPAAAMNNN
jgi:hypothetical protein